MSEAHPPALDHTPNCQVYGRVILGRPLGETDRVTFVRVLVIGSGAREHALLLALRDDPQVEALAIAPGNAGTAL